MVSSHHVRWIDCFAVSRSKIEQSLAILNNPIIIRKFFFPKRFEIESESSGGLQIGILTDHSTALVDEGSAKSIPCAPATSLKACQSPDSFYGRQDTVNRAAASSLFPLKRAGIA